MKLKRFLTKKWHGIPVAIVSALLALVLLAGGVLAAGYNFFNASVAVTVEEAITPSFGADDDLVPYMVDGSPLPLIELVNEDWGSPIVVNLAVSAKAEEDPDYDASEFLPGEELVLPINLRNRSNAVMPIGVAVNGAGLILKWDFETNTSGGAFRPSEPWTDFPASFDITTRGSFGSVEVGATVLFIKIGVPLNAAPGTSTLTITFNRG